MNTRTAYDDWSETNWERNLTRDLDMWSPKQPIQHSF